MVLNFDAFRSGQASYADAVRDVTHTDLYKATDELFDTIQSILEGLTDTGTTFVPHDPGLKDSNKQAYTLGHVIVHLTASLEETASLGSTLARGVAVEGRSRNGVPWETIHTAQQVHDRLIESHSMCHAFLDAWPDAPHLGLTITIVPSLGPMNAVSIDALGIFHGQSHIEQLREIMRQSKTLA